MLQVVFAEDNTKDLVAPDELESRIRVAGR
jgi:hypothetical protein